MFLRNLMSNTYPFIRSLFVFLTGIYSVLSAYYFLSLPGGSVDEILFLNDLQIIDSKGWITAIKQNISIPYMALTYPLSVIIGNVAALRLVNIFLLLEVGS